MKRMPILVVLALAAAALPASTRADNPTLVGTVGPGFTIQLQDSAGNQVSHLDPGTYTLLVHDLANVHDFHLSGPGVNVATEVEFVGDQTFTVTFVDGSYTYVCDVHPSLIHGAFTVGTPPPPPPPPPLPPTPVVATKVAGSVGPGARIALLPGTAGAGNAVLTVRDSSAKDDFHLKGPGLDRKTGIAFKGTVVWKARLRAGTYTAWDDAHPAVRRKLVVS